MLADFLSYVWSLAWSWLGLLAGGLGAVLALYERAKKKHLQPTWYVVILISFLVAAGFKAWHEEHTKSVALANQLADLQRETQKRMPNIRVTVEDMTVGRMSESSSTDSVVMLYLTIKNIGQMPSVVDRYLLKVDVLNRPTVRAENVVVAEDMIVQSPNGEHMKLSRSNAIYMKTLRPIAPGAMEQGVMVFLVRGVTEPELADAVCTLSWRDVWDRTSSLTSKMSRPPAGWKPPFIPGIEEQPLPPASPKRQRFLQRGCFAIHKIDHLVIGPLFVTLTHWRITNSLTKTVVATI